MFIGLRAPVPDKTPEVNDLAPKRAGNPGFMALLHAGFILTGVVNTMLGPLLPTLSQRWQLTDAHAGYLFTLQFAGSVLGVMGSSFLMSRRKHRIALIAGWGLMALGSAILPAGSLALGMLATLFVGLGYGLAIPTTNLLVSELNPHTRAASLSLINFSWGVGAAVCPFFVAGMVRSHSGFDFLYVITAMLLLLAVSTARIRFPMIDGVLKTVAGVQPRLWRSGWVPVLGLLFFLYVGCEAGVGGWTATYAQRMSYGSSTLWVLTPSFFWAALLLGRVLAPLLLKTIPELTLAPAGLALSTLGLLTLLAARNIFVLAAAVALAGLGFSSVFPIAIAALSRKFGADAPRIAGLMFALAGAGGATLPWLIGYTSTVTGNLKQGLLIPLFGCIGMFILNLALAWRE